jgi:hypothetical protein
MLKPYMADDLLVYDHKNNLKKLLSRLRDVGLKLNKDKVKLAQSVISSDGVKVDGKLMQ